MKKPRNEAGFSLLELLIAMTFISILAVVMSEFFVRRLIDYNRTFVITSLQTNTKQAVETMESDIKFGTRVLANNQWPDTNSPGAPGNPYSWVSNANTPATVVIAVPSRDSSGNIIYADGLHTQLETNDVIYYISNNILYRRTVANPIAGNAAKTTCPPALATPSCPADAKVVEDIASLAVVYYDLTNTVTTTPAGASSIQITLQQSRTKFGRTFVSRLTSQASLRNR
jgi:prepilin-type N-terminal cleavage/methylation domain-containing protein